MPPGPAEGRHGRLGARVLNGSVGHALSRQASRERIIVFGQLALGGDDVGEPEKLRVLTGLLTTADAGTRALAVSATAHPALASGRGKYRTGVVCVGAALLRITGRNRRPGEMTRGLGIVCGDVVETGSAERVRMGSRKTSWGFGDGGRAGAGIAVFMGSLVALEVVLGLLRRDRAGVIVVVAVAVVIVDLGRPGWLAGMTPRRISV